MVSRSLGESAMERIILRAVRRRQPSGGNEKRGAGACCQLRVLPGGRRGTRTHPPRSKNPNVCASLPLDRKCHGFPSSPFEFERFAGSTFLLGTRWAPRLVSVRRIASDNGADGNTRHGNYKRRWSPICVGVDVSLLTFQRHIA